MACGFTVILFGTSLVRDTIKLEEAIETGVIVSLHAETVVTGLKVIGLAVFVAAVGSLYSAVIEYIGKVLNEDGEDDKISD